MGDRHEGASPHDHDATRLAGCAASCREVGQVVFGEKCGFYQTYLSRIERGQANPTLNAIEVIATALGMSVFDLFDQVKKQR